MLTDIKIIRLYRDITQLELARLSNVSDSTISNIEVGKKIPRIDTVCLLANGLSMSSIELFELLIVNEDFNNRNCSRLF